MQGANTDAGWRDKCNVRTPMQTAIGPKWQRMKMDYDSVLCAVSVLLLLCLLLLVFAPCSCVRTVTPINSN